jgi:hypothetical protein
MIEVINTEKIVKISRTFDYLRASETQNYLRIGYIEVTEIDGVEVSRVEKEYDRDYAFWKESELGVAILGMVNLDLAQSNPSTPRL